MLTRHRRQNRLSKESKAASRSLSRYELGISSLGEICEPTQAVTLSVFVRASYLACIRCLIVVHISVKQQQINGKQLDQSLHYDQFYQITNYGKSSITSWATSYQMNVVYLDFRRVFRKTLCQWIHNSIR